MAEAPKGLLDKIRVGLFQGVTPEEIETARFMRESVMKPTTEREYAASVVAGMPSMEDVAMGFLQGGPGSLAGLFAGAVKPKGGMWHPEAASRLAKPLQEKLSTRGNLNDLLLDTPGAIWANRAVQNYLNKYAGTADDPLKDIQIPFGQGTKRWEDVTDAIVTSTEAGRYKNREPLPDGMSYRGSTPSFPNVPPKEPIWRVESSAAVAPYEERKLSEVYLRQYLSHVGDYLKQNVAPEKLQQYDLVRAIRETAKWDVELARNMAKARAAEKTISPIYKEYPTGMYWQQLTKPGQFARESEAMGNSVRGYEPSKGPFTYGGTRPGEPHPDWIPESREGGHIDYGLGGWEAIKRGDTKVYSLRDSKGESHVTVEVSARDAYTGLQGRRPAGDTITQIKGKQNRAPNPEYLSYVQDFVKSGKWGEVGDLQNAGMVSIKGKYLTREEARNLYPDIDKHIPDFPR